MFQVGHDIYAVCDGKVLKWSFDEYTVAERENIPETVDFLTPSSVVNVCAHGFSPELHPSPVASDSL
jgi:hypothetical protein